MLSQSVASAFAYFNDPATVETQRFVSYFDKFFDCLNVRSFNEYVRKRKPQLKPYTSPSDERLKVNGRLLFTKLMSSVFPVQWLDEDFLKYLQDWEDSVNAIEDLEAGETLKGIRITGRMFTV